MSPTRLSAPERAQQTLSESRVAFLAETRARTPAALRGVDFQSILDRLIDWSKTRQAGDLEVREPGDQHTVSFGLADGGPVLWAAYPRREDGAKIVVLPKTFRQLPETSVRELLSALREVTPAVTIRGTGALQVPMHLLASERALAAFEQLLVIALRVVPS